MGQISVEITAPPGSLLSGNQQLTNNCVPVDDFEAVNVKLAALRERLDADESRQNLAVTEGGTGYAKIIRILRHDLLTRFVLEFGYTSPNEYAVKIGVEGRAIIK